VELIWGRALRGLGQVVVRLLGKISRAQALSRQFVRRMVNDAARHGLAESLANSAHRAVRWQPFRSCDLYNNGGATEHSVGTPIPRPCGRGRCRVHAEAGGEMCESGEWRRRKPPSTAREPCPLRTPTSSPDQ
jgi:hypothetical protein